MENFSIFIFISTLVLFKLCFIRVFVVCSFFLCVRQAKMTQTNKDIWEFDDSSTMFRAKFTLLLKII